MKNTLTTIGAVLAVFFLTYPTLSDEQACASGQDCPVAKYSGIKGDLVPNGKLIPLEAKCVVTKDKNIIDDDNNEIIIDYKTQPDKIINTSCIASIKKRFILTITGTELNDQLNKDKKPESKAITVIRGFLQTISNPVIVQDLNTQPDEPKNYKSILTRTSKTGAELPPHAIASFSVQLKWNNLESKKLKIIEHEHQWETINDKGSYIEYIAYSPNVHEGTPDQNSLSFNRLEWLLPCKKCGAVNPPEPIKE